MEKMYPFSVTKHAHDIEFRRNRVKNEICDFENGNSSLNKDSFEQLINLESDLTELLLAMHDSNNGRVCYLTGKQIGLAKETVAWACNMRRGG